MLSAAQDNVINQMVLATYCKKLGYAHTVCSNGLEAVERYTAAPVPLIIMDIEMPVRLPVRYAPRAALTARPQVMDGREATRRIRALEERAERAGRPAAVIVALSGNARPGLMQDAYDTGLDDYLTKPCSMPELARMLSKWEAARPQ
jgi:CheY-like chemotaxis protein